MPPALKAHLREIGAKVLVSYDPLAFTAISNKPPVWRVRYRVRGEGIDDPSHYLEWPADASHPPAE